MRAVRFACALLVVGAAHGHAQDFATADPRAEGASALLEHALPAAHDGLSAEAVHTRWWAVPGLETRSAALGAGWRGSRVALGLARTGDPGIGWSTAALAWGGASARGGAALRVAWRDEPGRARGAAQEWGAGAWLAPTPALRVWASAPQARTRGPAPPLARALRLGARLGGETALWVTLDAPRAGDDGVRALGAALGTQALSLWLEVRDAPLRGAGGLTARAAGLEAAVRVEAHPVLGETLRVALAWRGRS